MMDRKPAQVLASTRPGSAAVSLDRCCFRMATPTMKHAVSGMRCRRRTLSGSAGARLETDEFFGARGLIDMQWRDHSNTR